MGKKKTERKDGPTEAEKLEVKKQSFIRVATPRTNNALKAIRLVGMCSSANYASSDPQKKAIILALETAVEDVKQAFMGGETATEGFVLPEK